MHALRREPSWMRLGRHGWALLAALICVAAFAGCGSEPDDDASGNNGASARGGTLVIDASFGQLSTLDPHREASTHSLYVNHARFATLMTFEGADTAKPVPALAESMEAASDGKSFTFHLRDDATFADGSPITAEDVVFSLNRVTKFEGGTFGQMFPEGKVTFEAPDPQTVVVRTAKPFPGTPNVLTSPQMSVMKAAPVRQHGGVDNGKKDTASQWLSTAGAADVGSGPYTLRTFTPNKEIVLERNENYWGEEPGYDKIIVRNVAGPSQPLQVQRGSSELAVDIPATDISRLKGNTRVRVESAPSANLMVLYLTGDPKVSDVTSNQQLRDAVRYAIDYDRITSLAGPGAVQPTGMLPAPYHGALPPEEAIEQDVDKAKQLYAESGVTEPFSISYPTDLPVGGVQSSIVAQSIKNDLDAAGI